MEYTNAKCTKIIPISDLDKKCQRCSEESFIFKRTGFYSQRGRAAAVMVRWEVYKNDSTKWIFYTCSPEARKK
jgi:hypothetical protein